MNMKDVLEGVGSLTEEEDIKEEGDEWTVIKVFKGSISRDLIEAIHEEYPDNDYHICSAYDMDYDYSIHIKMD